MDFGFRQNLRPQPIDDVGLKAGQVFDVAIEAGFGQLDVDGHFVQSLEHDLISFCPTPGRLINTRSICCG